MAELIFPSYTLFAYNTEAYFTDHDRILKNGEVWFSSDKSGAYRIGDGVHKWSELSYAAPCEVDSALSSASAHPVQNQAVTQALSQKAALSHTHPKAQITDFPAALKNPAALTLSLNGTSQGAYDGSAAKSVNITAASVGAAAASHSHNYAGSASAGGAAATALACSGNAATATALQTARTINGTSFNGSANITTANWGTARTITIGATGKSVNGSGNVAWSLGEIGAAAASHSHNYAGSASAGGAAATALACSGNAATATALKTARTINGTSFNGSANITTANWGTARTITIGATGKSVNGGGNVAWSLGEIGAAAASHSHSYLPLSGGTVSGNITATGAVKASNLKFDTIYSGSTQSSISFTAANYDFLIINGTPGSSSNMVSLAIPCAKGIDKNYQFADDENFYSFKLTSSGIGAKLAGIGGYIKQVFGGRIV